MNNYAHLGNYADRILIKTAIHMTEKQIEKPESIIYAEYHSMYYLIQQTVDTFMASRVRVGLKESHSRP